MEFRESQAASIGGEADMPDMSPEDFMAMLAKLFGKESSPQSDNPEAYPHSAKVEDGDVLMMITELERRRAQARRKTDELELMWHESMALRRRVFLALEDKYPSVLDNTDGGTGWRKWKNEIYYVGWDHGQKGGGGIESKDRGESSA